MPNQPLVPIWFAATLVCAQATVAFVVAGGHSVGIPDLYLFILAAVNVALSTLGFFLNIHWPNGGGGTGTPKPPTP